MSYEQKIKKSTDTSGGFKYKSPNGDVLFKKETIDEIKKLPICENKERGISKETMEAYGVRCAFSEETGKICAYYFPSYNKKGELTGYSKQDLTKDKGEKFHWSTVGTVDIENKLFGQQYAESIQNKTKTLIITEGQWDCLSAYQARKHCLDNSQYSKLKPFVVSIPMGTINAKKSALINKKYITSFDELLIHFDNDTVTEEEAKKGIKRGLEATQDVISVLSGESIRLKTFNHEERFKDASDYLQSGVKNGKLKEAMEYLDSKYWKVKDAEAEKIVKFSDFDLEELLKPLSKGIELVDFPKLDEMLYGLRPKECTVITAGSGCYPPDTEFFSQDGWKKISDYADGDKVLEFDKNDGTTKLNYPESYVVLPTDQFYEIKNSRFSFITSENHKHLMVSPNGTLKTPKTIELYEDHHEKARGNRLQTVNTFFYSGEGIDYSEDYLRLKVAIFADGSFNKNSRNNAVTVKLKKDREKERLVKLLDSCEISYTRNDNVNGYSVFYFHADNRDKQFPKSWYECSNEQMKIICDEIFHWDGSILGRSNSGRKRTKSYHSMYKSDMDFLQFCFSSIGVSTTIGCDFREKYKNEEKTCYYLRLNYSNGYGITKDLKKKKTTEINKVDNISNQMYCFTTNTGFFVVRQGGKVFVSGNSGKTTIASKIGETAKKQGKRIGNIYLEESSDKTVQRYISSALGVGFKEFRRNPLGCGYTREQITEVFNKLVQKDDVIMLDHFGSMPISELMSKIKYMHVVENCDLIIVDHLSMVISGSDVKDERKELDMVMTQIASFCESHNVHVILIVHINRKNGEGQTVPKDKDGNEKPYWIRINLTSLRGSAGIEQLANNVIAIESEQLPDRKRGRVRFAVLKNREGGELGEADYFKINPVTWEVVLCDEDDKGSDISVNMIKDTPTVVDKSKFSEIDLDELPF